jgi:uncharacterized protein YqjF (DUF2071 family)
VVAEMKMEENGAAIAVDSVEEKDEGEITFLIKFYLN